MGQGLAIVVGSTISAVIALAVLALEHRFEARATARSQRADRLAKFSAASHDAALGIGALARAAVADKDEMAAARRGEQDRLNTLLSSILILEDRDLVAAAVALDDGLIALSTAARERVWTREEWPTERARVMSEAVDRFQLEARRAVGATRLPGGAPRRMSAANRSAVEAPPSTP